VLAFTEQMHRETLDLLRALKPEDLAVSVPRAFQ
jgi:hypothetical protein